MALFDLDGTITRHDTLGPYLWGFLRRHPARWARLPAGLPALARFALGRADRGALKSAWIRALLGGSSRAEVSAWTAQFVPQLLARGLHADARRAIDTHRAAGDLLVLMSASPDLYVPDIGRALGFAQTLCTAIRWRGTELDGALDSPNRRGAEKARCLVALRERYPQLPLTAYGNAASDLAHLALADRAVLINGSRAARAAAARLNMSCLSWH